VTCQRLDAEVYCHAPQVNSDVGASHWTMHRCRIEVDPCHCCLRWLLRALVRRWRRRRRWRWMKLEPGDAISHVLEAVHHRRHLLQERAERLIRGLLLGLERYKLVQACGHHVLESCELLHHGLHRRLTNGGNHLQLVLGWVLLRR
jgi:hypothetical protein